MSLKGQSCDMYPPTVGPVPHNCQTLYSIKRVSGMASGGRYLSSHTTKRIEACGRYVEHEKRMVTKVYLLLQTAAWYP
jgi:hypothetical protein